MDNATGIATMLEVARAMSRRPTARAARSCSPPSPPREAACSAPQYLANNPVVGSGRWSAVVNLDMPILTYDFQDVIAFGAEHSTLGPIVERAGGADELRLSPIRCPRKACSPARTITGSSSEGVPSVFLMTGFGKGGRGEFTGFLATHYHSASDDLDLPFNWARRRQVRAAELSDRARDRRRAGGAALVRRTASSARVRRHQRRAQRHGDGRPRRAA